MVKRGNIKEPLTEPEKRVNLYKETYSQIVSSIGVGTLGISVLKYKEFSFNFYAISLASVFLFHFAAQLLITKLSKFGKLNSVIGVAASFGPFHAHFSVISFFSALLVMSAICFDLTIFSSYAVITECFTYNMKLWVFAGIIGGIFISVILFIKERVILYPWARYSFAGLLVFGTIAIFLSSSDSILEYSSKSFKRTFSFSFKGFEEYLTLVGIFSTALFSASLKDPSILEARKNTTKSEDSLAKIIPSILSNSLAFIIYMGLLIVHREKIMYHFLTNAFIQTNWIRIMLSIFAAISVFTHSLEYLDRANVLIYEFYKPLIKEKIQSMDQSYFRTSLLILLIFGISFFLYDQTYPVEKLCSSLYYIFCITLSGPFLILPSYFMIYRSRKFAEGLSVWFWLICCVLGTIGIVSLLSSITGLASIQSPFIILLMKTNVFNTILISGFCLVIYIIFMIVDLVFYPPKSPLPINIKNINSLSKIEYGNNYAAEILIIICVAITFIARGNFDWFNRFIWSWKVGGMGIIDLLINNTLRIFLHGNVVHLILCCSAIYSFGKSLSKEIGPYHFIAFFLTAGLLSEMLENVLSTHLFARLGGGIGSSGVIFAIIAKYILEDSNFMIYSCIPVSAYEKLVYSVVVCTFLILTGFIPEISHSSHLAGLIFGLFFWDASIRIWKFRDTIHQKFIKKKS